MDLRVKSFFIKFKQFYYSNNQVQNFKTMTVINNLDNNSSNHQIILSKKIVFSICLNSYIFNLSSDSQYNNIEFKKLHIDLNVLTQSIDSIS